MIPTPITYVVTYHASKVINTGATYVDAVVVKAWVWLESFRRIVLVGSQELAKKMAVDVWMCRNVERETAKTFNASQTTGRDFVNKIWRPSKADVEVLKLVMEETGDGDFLSRGSLEAFSARNFVVGAEKCRENTSMYQGWPCFPCHGQWKLDALTKILIIFSPGDQLVFGWDLELVREHCVHWKAPLFEFATRFISPWMQIGCDRWITAKPLRYDIEGHKVTNYASGIITQEGKTQ